MAVVLLIDDDPVQLELVETGLIEEGHTVCAVSDATHIVKVYRECQPDWVVLDVKMPPPGGLMVLSSLVGAGITPRVVLWSAYVSPEAAKKVLAQTKALGVEAYVEKDGIGGNLLRFLG